MTTQRAEFTSAWIEVVDETAAEGQLARLYRKLVDPAHGGVDNILKVHSLHFEGLRAHLKLYATVMEGSQGVPKVDREMIALTVSVINQCHY